MKTAISSPMTIRKRRPHKNIIMIECRTEELATIPTMIEVGQFVLISRVFPEKTAWFWMGRQNPGPLASVQKRLTIANVFKLRQLLHFRPQPWVFAHVPIRTTHLRMRALIRMLHGDYGRLAYRELLRTNNTRLVGMDFNDGMQLSPIALQILDRSICFFKRELATDLSKLLPHNATRKHRELLYRNAHKLLPVSLGLCTDRQSKLPSVVATKTSDLFFAGGLTSEIRRREVGLLDLLKEKGVRVDRPSERLNQAEFFQRCSQSHLVWSPEGCGWDCFRHYEASASGSVPIINEPTIVPYQPLLHEQHALYYTPITSEEPHGTTSHGTTNAGLVETVLRALQDRERLVAMGMAGREHILQHHTHQKIVDYMIQSQLLASSATE